MPKYTNTFLALIWASIIALFLREVYLYAFVEDLGLFTTLQILGNEVQGLVTEAGVFAPFFFILLYTLRPLILFPASIMTLTSVFVFGLYGGFFVSYVGEMLSACVAFFIGKYFGNSLHITPKINTTKVGKYFTDNPFLSVLMLRIVPVFPFDFVNYASGIMKVPFYPYITASLIGVLPGLLSYVFLGFSLMHTEYLLYSLGFLALLMVSSHYGKRFLYQK